MEGQKVRKKEEETVQCDRQCVALCGGMRWDLRIKFDTRHTFLPLNFCSEANKKGKLNENDRRPMIITSYEV